jgi:protein-S-isoprenylcysteine O-methyltransferase Ste14
MHHHHRVAPNETNFDIWNIPADWFGGMTEIYIFRIIIVAWMVSEIIIWLVTSAGHGSTRKNLLTDRGSVLVVIAGFCLSIYVAFFMRESGSFVFPRIFYWVGTVLMVLGIVLRCFSVWTLKSSFTLSVMVKSGQSLVQSGPYRYLRHPAYTGSIMTLTGFAFVLGSAFAPLVVLAICIFCYRYRIMVEERVLLEKFGGEYRDYCKRTWRIIPFIW